MPFLSHFIGKENNNLHSSNNFIIARYIYDKLFLETNDEEREQLYAFLFMIIIYNWMSLFYC